MAEELELSRSTDVLRYLAGTPFACSRVESLSNAVVNFVYRLHLQTPYDGRDTLIMKHGKGWFSASTSVITSIERQVTFFSLFSSMGLKLILQQNYEVMAIKSVNAVLPPHALARAPMVYHHDTKEHVLILEDCGQDSCDLKELLKDARLDVETCRVIGHEVGTFLAAIHRECTKDRALMDCLSQNIETKQLAASVYFGRLLSTLTGERKSNTGEAILDPPLRETLSAETMKAVDEIEQENYKATLATVENGVFLMGDFRTPNIVVRTNVDASGALNVERILVIDWEFTKAGSPCDDFGHFLAEMHSLRRFHKAAAGELVDEMLKEFFAAYTKGYPVDEMFVRGATTHAGAHLVSWTPDPAMAWEPKEMVREVVEEGVEYLVMSKRENFETLRETPLMSFFPEVN